MSRKGGAIQSAGRKSITRSFLYKRYKKLFWYLVLFDREWFDNHFPPGGWGATEFLPSIEADRISILRAIEKATRHSVRIWANLAQQAYFRASLRDGKWLEDRKQDTILQAHRDKQWQQQEHLRECTDEIQRGIEIIRAAHGTPPNISPAVIAPYTALNESQIRHFLANNPDIRAYLGKKISLRNSK